MNSARCFVAAPLPAAVSACCAAAIDALQPRAPKTRWAKPAQLHLTLRFFGNVTRGALPDLEAAIRAGAAGHAPFALRTADLGMFGSARRPRVLWLGLAGDVEALGVLHQAIDDACAPLGFARETRPFHPHLTLGRVKPGRQPSPPDWLEAIASPPTVGWTVDAVHLYESTLHPAGSRHTILAVCSLCDK